MPKKVTSNNKRGCNSSLSTTTNNADSSSIELPSIPKRYTHRCTVKESHNQPIYCIAFSRHVHNTNNNILDDDDDGDDDDGTTASCFATCGGSYATIYEVVNNNNNNSNNQKKKKNKVAVDDAATRRDATARQSQPSPLTARQIYKDVDDGETFYTCAFGGRGVMGCSPTVGTAVTESEKDGNKTVGSADGIIYFGDEEKTTTLPTPSPSKKKKKSAKRQKKPKSDDAQQQQHDTNPSSFLLPYSNTAQNGPPLLCLGGTRGIIKVIDTIRRSLFMTLSGHGNDVTDLKFSPTNEWLLLSASKDETIRLWNVQRGVNVAVFTGHNGHRGQVLSVSWHLSGSKFASCAMDNMIKLWKVYDDDDDDDNSGKAESECGPVETALRKSQNVIPDGCAGGESDSNEKFETVFQQFPYFSTNKVHINYVGKHLFLACYYYCLIHHQSDFCSTRFALHIIIIDCVQFIGDLILSKSIDNRVVLWKPQYDNEEDKEQDVYTTHRVPSSILYLREFELENCGSWYVRFESPPPYHQLLALGNQLGEVKVWHVSGTVNEKYFCNLTTTMGNSSSNTGDHHNQSTVRMVAFNPHGSSLVAIKDDSTVWMWDAVS